VPKSLKAALDALDLALVDGTDVSTLRGRLIALRDQVDTVESERDAFATERDDLKSKLDEAERHILALDDEIAQWKNQPGSDDL
jgi:hypothetical protein